MPSIAGYRHLRGVHCGSAALRNLLLHHTGIEYSESMCFGLGGGMSFTYVKEPGSATYMITGRGSYIEANFCDALNVQLEVTSSDDAECAWQHLRDCVDAGEPVMVDTDMFELPYMVQRLGLENGVHFGGHKLLVTGYDDATATVTLADYAWSAPRELPASVLRNARDSRQGTTRPGNACFHFHFPDRLPELREAIPIALSNTVKQMLHPYLHFNGLPAIVRFCRQVPRWNLAMQGEELRRNLAMAAFMLEKAGTGGGAFRNMFSRFLDESADILDAALLRQAAATYRSLSFKWREIARLMDLAAADPAAGILASGPEMLQLTNALAEQEEQGISLIAQYLKQSHVMKAFLC